MTEESGGPSQESGGKKERRIKKKEEEKEKVFLNTNYPDIILLQKLIFKSIFVEISSLMLRFFFLMADS